MKIYRYITTKGEVCEYRFENDICLGCFVSEELIYPEYKDKKLTDTWENNLKESGFELVDLSPTP